MKKLLLALLIFPLALFGANTNLVDNLWVRTSFRYTPGAAAGSIFTSDASGNASWSVAGASGDVFLNGMTTTKMNNYTAGTSNFFRGPVMLGNDNISPLIFISAGTAATNIVERHRMYIDTASGNVWKLDSTAGTAMTEDFGRITINQLFRTLDGVTIGDAAGDAFTINSAALTVPNGLNVQSGLLMISSATSRVGIGTTAPLGRLHVVGLAGSPAIEITRDNGIFTSESTAAIRIQDTASLTGLLLGIDTNANFAYIQPLDPSTSYTTRPLALNPNGGAITMFSTNFPGSGKFQVNTPVTAAPTADVMINASVSNQVPLFIQGKAGQTVNVLTIEDSAGVDLTTVSSSGRLTTQALTVNATTSGSAINTTSINGQALRVGAGTVAGTNTVLVGTPGNIAPQLIIQSTNGTSYIQVNGVGTISIGTNTVSALPFRAILTASNTLDFGNILAAASADLTITVSGARANDAIAEGLPTAPDASISFDYFVSADNTVTVRAHNVGSLAVDQAPQVHRATVIKY